MLKFHKFEICDFIKKIFDITKPYHMKHVFLCLAADRTVTLSDLRGSSTADVTLQGDTSSPQVVGDNDVFTAERQNSVDKSRGMLAERPSDQQVRRSRDATPNQSLDTTPGSLNSSGQQSVNG